MYSKLTKLGLRIKSVSHFALILSKLSKLRPIFTPKENLMIIAENKNECKLSRLDFVHVYKDSNAVVSLANTIEAVKSAHQLGFLRFWFAGL